MKILTNNTKTILSLDFNRDKTCPSICSYCYVDKLERIYPAYSSKLTSNYEQALQSPETFASIINAEYKKARKSKSKAYAKLHKLPLRIYGSGDYIPAHYNFMKHLDCKFYIISKSLTMSTMSYHRTKLFKLNNLTQIVFSFDSNNLQNYKNVKQLYNRDRVAFAFTGTPQEFTNSKTQGLKFNIFFNTAKNKSSVLLARKHNEQCPCDTDLIPSSGACTVCNKCWRSSVKPS